MTNGSVYEMIVYFMMLTEWVGACRAVSSQVLDEISLIKCSLDVAIAE